MCGPQSCVSIAHQQMTANLDFVVGRYHERPFAVCEQTRMMASTLSDSVSSIVGSLSGNLGRKRRCLRAEAATVASAYSYGRVHVGNYNRYGVEGVVNVQFGHEI